MDTKLKRLLSDTIVFSIGNLLNKLILFFLMPLYTAYMSVPEFAIADTSYSIVEIILPIFTLCIADAAFRFSIDGENNQTDILTNCLFVLVIGFIFLSVVLHIVSAIYAEVIYIKYANYIVLMFFTYSIRQLFGNLIRGMGNSKLFALNGVVASILLLLFNMIFLLYYNYGINGYFLSIILSNFIPSVFLFVYGKLYKFIDTGKINKSFCFSMIKYSLPMVPNMISWWVNTTISRYILVFFEGLTVTGLYSAASKLPAMINLFSSIFQQAWQYSSSKAYKDNDKYDFYSHVFGLYSNFILVVCSGMILILPYIAKFVLLGDFYKAWRYVPLLLVSSTIGCYSVYYGGFYTATKENVMLMGSTVLGSIVNIISLYILVPKFGVYGALISSNLCYLSILIIRIFDTKRYVKLQVSWVVVILSLNLIFLQAVFRMLEGTSSLEGYLSIAFFIVVVIVNATDYINNRRHKY